MKKEYIGSGKPGLYFAALLIFFVIVAAGKPILSAICDWSRLKSVRTHTGSVRNMLKGPTNTLGMLNIKAITMYPGKATHQYLISKGDDELLIVREGTADVSINSVSEKLGEGSITLASQGDRVQIRNTAQSKLGYYLLTFKPKSVPSGKQAIKRTQPFFSSWDTVTFKPLDIGGRRYIIDCSTASLKQLEIHATTLKEGISSHSAHNHPDEEIILVKTGTVEASINDKTSTCGPGSVIFITNNDNHGVRNAGTGDCVYYAIRWIPYSSGK